MTEHNNETESVEAIVHDHNELVIEGLRLEITALNEKIERLNSSTAYQVEQYSTLKRFVTQAKEAVFDAIKNEEIDADNDLVEALAEIFGWSLTQEVTITLTATFEGTLTMPLGASIDDIDGSDFTAEISLDWDRTRQDWDFDLENSDIELEQN